TYRVAVRAYSTGWTTLYSASDQAASFSVTTPAPTSTPTPTVAPTPTPTATGTSTATPVPTATPALATIAYRAGSTNGSTSGLSLTLNVPAGVQNGDLLVATVADWPGALTA